jgi:serine/threonine-protein kinase
VSERHLGQTLGKYRIEELIGSGGFAWVYKAFDPELEIHVALKVLKPQFAGDETFEERFRREAATAAKLRHPNIIKIYSVGRHGDAVYFAMDYYPGGLAERLEVSNSLPEEFVVRVGVDVAQALGYAHREGVIHRDIKVDNILFDAHGNAVVADFGIARAVSGYTGQTGTNMVVGTPQYFAPEQARAKALDGRADIYSLGVTLFRASTGRLPFEGDDWYEIARQHVEEPPPAPRSINPDLTPAFEAAILHCLQKQPDDRPATGELFAQELVTLLPATLETSAYRSRITGSEPTLIVRTDSKAVAVSNGAAPTERSRSTPWIIGVATLAIVFMIGMRVLGFSRTTPPQQPPAKLDSAGAVTPPVAPPTTVLPAPDTAVRRDSTVAVAPRTGTVRVTAPENATFHVKGREVPLRNGIWRADTLLPGPYELTASVPAPLGCSTASMTKTVTVRAGVQTQATLTPRGCGRLVFSSGFSNARWALTSLTPGDPVRSGSVPANETLPVGDYQRAIMRDKCSPYIDTVSVTANRTDTLSRRNPYCP